MELVPELAAIRNTRGSTLMALGRYEEGITLLAPTLPHTQRPSLGDTHTRLALGHAALGNVYEARRHSNEAHAVGYRARPLEEALARCGSLEVEVARGYMRAGSAEQSAASMRRDAGLLAATIGRSLLATIESTGEDRDLLALARLLVGGTESERPTAQGRSD